METYIFHISSLLTETELSEITPELLSRMEKHVAEGVAVDDALINHHLTDPYIFSEYMPTPNVRPYSKKLELEIVFQLKASKLALNVNYQTIYFVSRR